MLEECAAAAPLGAAHEFAAAGEDLVARRGREAPRVAGPACPAPRRRREHGVDAEQPQPGEESAGNGAAGRVKPVAKRGVPSGTATL